MSLENKIEQLTLAVEALILVLENKNASEQVTEQVVEQVVELVVEQVVETAVAIEEKAATVTAQDVKDLCLKISRENPEKYKPLIKDLISSYGATTVGQVKVEELASLHADLLGL